MATIQGINVVYKGNQAVILSPDGTGRPEALEDCQHDINKSCNMWMLGVTVRHHTNEAVSIQDNMFYS